MGKSNLDKYYKTDEKCENEGIWMNVDEKIGFLVRRFGGFNQQKLKQAAVKHYKPYASQIKNDTIDPKKEREILTRAFVDACMIDWKGVEVEGQEIPYSKDEAVKLLLRLPDLCDSLREFASDSNNYKELEELGNS